MEIKKYTLGSLYAGVGGICLGFKNAGVEILWANEYDKDACITYRLNFDHSLFEKDIWELPPESLEPVDILVGGFPCQPFSVAGYRKGFEDVRGNHFFRIIKYAQEVKPKVIFLENVKNLKGHDSGNTFKVIEAALEANDYSFESRVLNSMEYGNIPQNRERVYIVAFKNNEDGSNIHSKNFKFPNPIPLTKTGKDIFETNEVEEKYFYRQDKYMYNELAKSISNKNTFYQWRRLYVRENKSNVCPTLTANMGTGGHNVPLILTDEGIRKLTPRECFRLQGFPPDFKLPEKMSNSSLYKQAGNSVTVPVIERIANNIIKVLNGNFIQEDVEYFEKGSVLQKSLF